MMLHHDHKAVHALRRVAKPGKQRGVVLVIALIALVALTLSGIALMRSVDTGNVIAGNFAFKQAALHASDTGVEKAFTDLPTIIATSLNTDISGQYFATMQAVDAKDVPTTIDWSTSVTPATAVSSYNVQYVIDRLCNGPTPVTDIAAQCLSYGSSSVSVYYRVTVRVTGPRNTVSMVQAIISVPVAGSNRRASWREITN